MGLLFINNNKLIIYYNNISCILPISIPYLLPYTNHSFSTLNIYNHTSSSLLTTHLFNNTTSLYGNLNLSYSLSSNHLFYSIFIISIITTLNNISLLFIPITSFQYNKSTLSLLIYSTLYAVIGNTHHFFIFTISILFRFLSYWTLTLFYYYISYTYCSDLISFINSSYYLLSFVLYSDYIILYYFLFYSPFIYFMASYTISFIYCYGFPIYLQSSSIAILSLHYIYYLHKHCFYFLLKKTSIIKYYLPHLSFKCSPSYFNCYAY
jgi:hypothetical protein